MQCFVYIFLSYSFNSHNLLHKYEVLYNLQNVYCFDLNKIINLVLLTKIILLFFKT
jgi:hypothetical protein